jgi:hypothetical protein
MEEDWQPLPSHHSSVSLAILGMGGRNGWLMTTARALPAKNGALCENLKWGLIY